MRTLNLARINTGIFVEKAIATGNYPFDGIAVLGYQFPSSGIAFEDLPQENLAALLEVGFFKVFMKTKENPEGAEDAASTQREQSMYEANQSSQHQASSSTDGYPTRPYSDEAWLKFTVDTIANYEYSYRLRHPSGEDYVSWKGHDKSSFGVIDWQIPKEKAIVSEKDTVLPDLVNCNNTFEYQR